jgi:predicted dehydrogenase
VPEGEPLRLEIDDFLEAVRRGGPPRVSGEDGRRALALAQRINDAMSCT